MLKKTVFPIVVLLLLTFTSEAQSIYLPLNQQYNMDVQKAIYSPDFRFHTSVRPYYLPEVKAVFNYDSLENGFRMHHTYQQSWRQHVWNKLFNDNVISVKGKNFSLAANPLMNFSLGRDIQNKETTWVNTRGIEISGTIGKHFGFHTKFYENQGIFPEYVNQYVIDHKVVPGQGRIHVLLDNTGEHYYLNGKSFDYSIASGYVSWQAGKYFNFQFGHGKNFFGDGYRSLLLSDNASNNLFLKATVNFWHLKYQVLVNQYIDLQDSTLQLGYARKYSVVHYLSWAISKRVNFSFFDAVVWQRTDSKGNYRGFDVQYLNPVVFLRSTEFSVGSPDNALLGANLSVIVGKHSVFYGQLIIDEFVFKKIIAGTGYWGNKQGFQLGFKTFDAFKVRNLYLQTEFNYVPPYTYSEQFERINYGHYNQPLAHPFGANFWESVNFLRYRYKRYYFQWELLYSIYGQDPPGMNYGGDIYKSYNTRVKEYGNYVGQGIRTRLFYQNMSASFLINPKYNLNFTVGAVFRSLKTNTSVSNTTYIYLGLRTSLRNLYYDF